MSGMVGRFMQSFGLTMAFAVMVSLLVSFTLTPMMCARWLKVKPRTEDEEHHVHDSKHSVDLRADRSRLHAACSSGRWRIAASWPPLAVLVLLSSVPLFRIVNVNFTPQDDQSEFEVSLRAPEGTSLEATDVMANRVAAAIRRIPEVDLHDGHRGRRRGRHAEHRVAVREAEGARRARPRPVRRSWTRCATRSCRRPCRTGVRDVAGGARHRRRRWRWRRRRRATSSS